MSARVVAVVGPVASGKTTLARRLSRELPGMLIEEDYAGNPFLAESYLGRDELRFAAQCWFLLSRVSQLSRGRLPEGGLTVCDYGMLTDSVFAHIWLAGEPLGCYEALARRVTALVAPASLVIHLDGPEELLLERIARRGRYFEGKFDRDFLAKLRNSYNDAVSKVDCPVLPVDASGVDLADSGSMDSLVGRIYAAVER